MASTYTPLGVELQATGENAGTWGTKTNTNLQIIEQIVWWVYTTINSRWCTNNCFSLFLMDQLVQTLAHRMIEFTGTITGNQIVTIPLMFKLFIF